METQKLPEILTTDGAAKALNRRSQTLRRWACYGAGPIQPVRIHGRLGWRAEDLRRLIEGEPDERAGAAQREGE